MDYLSTVVQLIGSFVSMVLLPVLLLRSQKKKAEAEVEAVELENSSKYAENWKDLYLETKSEEKAKDQKIDQLYVNIGELRDKLREANEKITELSIQNQALEFRKCNKRGCPDRLPPSEF